MTDHTPDNGPDQAPCCRRMLSSPEDAEHLSQLMCLTRAQIEVFAANSDDIAARAKRGGTNQHFEVGRVGIRCIHCAHLPTGQRAKGAVSYPISIRIMNQAVRNWQRYHFEKCDRIPADVKERYRSLQGMKGSGVHSKKTSRDYWVETCKRMGLVDTDAENGIRYASASLENETSCSEAAESLGIQASIISEPELHVPVIADSAAGGNVESIEVYDDLDVDELFSGILLDDSELLGQVDLSAKSLDEDEFDLLQDMFGSSVSLQEGFQGLSGEGTMTLADAPVSDEKVGPRIGAETTTTAQEQLLAPQDDSSKDDILESVRLALRRASSVREDHDKGLLHFCSTSFDGAILSDEQVRNDLVNLGHVFYELFAGVDPRDENGKASAEGEEAEEAKMNDEDSAIAENAPNKKTRERRSNNCAHAPLRDLGFPVSLSLVVSSLMDARDNDTEDRYDTAHQVEEDLHLMVGYPGRYLYDASGEILSGELVFPDGRLYGRDSHVSKLMGAVDRVTTHDKVHEMVLVSGYSGTGKSVLVEEVHMPVKERNGFFISGKFDALSQVQPLAVVFAAFDEFCKDLVEGGQGNHFLVTKAIKDALGSNGYVLMDLIPNLARVIGECTHDSIQVGGKEGMNRLAYFFKIFVRAIASHSQPVILFLDDLQWADEATLNLISMLVSDADMSSLLFIGSYRDNEVKMDHPLNAAVGSIALAGVSTLRINLDNIDCECVNELVSDTLHLSPRLTRSLGDVVYTKTSGNPFFVIQFLQSLYDEHLLTYSAGSRRWEWDVEAIQAKDIADNVVDLMKEKITELGTGTRRILKVAACLGSQSDISTLQLLKPEGGSSFMSYLDIIIREGLMSRVGSCCKFSHDRIQEAAYLLIPENERDAMHLHIGRLLWKRASEEELNNILFILVDQLHRGSSLIIDHDEKVKVATLSLMAGERARASSIFLPASLYFLQGCFLLGEEDWEHHYDLCLRLFTCCAEAQYVLGNYEGVVTTITPVFEHGRSLQDKLTSYYMQLYSLGAQGRNLDTINHGLNVLKKLGESFTFEPSKEEVAKEFAKTRAMLEGTSPDAILQMNIAEGANAIAAMNLLNILSRYAYQVKQDLTALMTFRMVQLSLCRGVCEYSPLAFALYGSILCSLGEMEEGYVYGKLALSLLERFTAKVHLPRVYVCVYSMINIFTEPVQASLPSLMHAYEVGMTMGDIEWTIANAAMYAVWAIQCGTMLGPLSVQLWEYVRHMKEYKHQSLMISLPVLQAILNLIGDAVDPTELAGQAMDEGYQEELLAHAIEKNLPNVTTWDYILRMWLAFMFRRYDVAAEMAELLQITPRPGSAGYAIFETFYSGLVAIVMLRDYKQQGEWRSIADAAIEQMKVWIVQSTWNFEHKLDLLNAEMAYLNGDLDEAAKKYDDAIRAAGEHNFVQEQALACERAGIFYADAFSTVTGVEYFEKARKYYLQWGANRKAEDVSEHFLSSSSRV